MEKIEYLIEMAKHSIVIWGGFQIYTFPAIMYLEPHKEPQSIKEILKI